MMYALLSDKVHVKLANDALAIAPLSSVQMLREAAVGYAVQECVTEEDAPKTTPVRAADFDLPDAASVHSLLRSLHARGNETRLQFIDALRTLHDHSLFYELGYASYRQYCDRELGLGRTTSFDYLRVARALEELPCVTALFADGRLSWLQVREITRVATRHTEMEWVRFAVDETVQDLIAEVKHALRENRNTPRDRRLGVPNLVTRLAFEVTLEEKERVLTALAIMGEALGTVDVHPDEPTDGRNVIVRWADAVISGALPRTPVPATSSADARPAKADRPVPAQTVVYHQCPDCRSTTVTTRDGSVQVSPERVAALAPLANSVVISPEDELIAELMPEGEIDSPNSSRLARQVLHRDDLTCANPGCGRRRNLHAHHIAFRSNGGRTVLANEVTLCDMCHALVHKGLLDVTGSPATGLTWTPRPSAPGAETRDRQVLHAELRVLARSLSPHQESTMVDSVTPMQTETREAFETESRGRFESETRAPFDVDSPRPRDMEEVADASDLKRRLRLLEEGMESLSFTKDEARVRIHEAYAMLYKAAQAAASESGQPVTLPTDEAIFTLALYGEEKAAAVKAFHQRRSG